MAEADPDSGVFLKRKTDNYLRLNQKCKKNYPTRPSTTFPISTEKTIRRGKPCSKNWRNVSVSNFWAVPQSSFGWVPLFLPFHFLLEFLPRFIIFPITVCPVVSCFKILRSRIRVNKSFHHIYYFKSNRCHLDKVDELKYHYNRTIRIIESLNDIKLMMADLKLAHPTPSQQQQPQQQQQQQHQPQKQQQQPTWAGQSGSNTEQSGGSSGKLLKKKRIY